MKKAATKSAVSAKATKAKNKSTGSTTKKQPVRNKTPKVIKGPPTVISLTKIKQWYLPADAESYQVLKKAGVPLLRIHHSFLPTLRLIAKSNNFVGKEVSFEDTIIGPFREMLAETWNRKYGKAIITNKSMTFLATDPEKIVQLKKALPKLEELIHKFFTRWGFKYTPDYSESKGGNRVKFNLNYWFDSNKLPILNLEEKKDEARKIQLKLGFTRLTFLFEPQTNTGKHSNVHLTIESSQGGRWTPVKTTKCLYTEISNVLPLVTALMDVLNLDEHNEDNLAE